jgi:TetR/AcrR family transcriptional regulator, regulator of biofilm formation and stress response
MSTTAARKQTKRAPARPRGAARREALLQAVLTIVADVGADAVTHRRVAEVAGLPLASTTYWFDSKEHLLTAALELAAERDMARLREFLAERLDAAAPPGADPLGPDRLGADPLGVDPLGLAVAAILDPLDESHQANRGSLVATYALLLEAARRPALRAVARRWTAAYLDALGRLLGLAGSRQPEADAELLLGAADGLLIEQLAAGTTADLAPRLRRLAEALVAAP